MKKKNTPATKGDLLIVDDKIDNLRLLFTTLSQEGYEVRRVLSGKQALKVIEFEPPDLILLDIKMPDIDGYEVCTLLKKNEKTAEIPVIFLSALSEAIDKVKAFEVGGIDYITKPFQLSEVLARIENQLKIKRLQKTIQEQNHTLQELNHDLEALVEARTQELKQKNQKLIEYQDKLSEALAKEKEISKFKSNIIRIINHEFRTPLTIIFASVELLERAINKLDREQQARVFTRIIEAVRQLKYLFEEVLFFDKEKIEKLNLEVQSLDLIAFCRNLVREFDSRDRSPTIKFECERDFGQVKWNEKLLRQILANLLSNAIKFSPENSERTFTILGEANQVKFIVKDRGIGIPHSDRERMFESFYRGSNVGNIGGTGLGLSIVKKCVDLYRGQIECHSEVGVGTEFIVTLPISQPVWDNPKLESSNSNSISHST
ncbi:MAG: hybrid sensor histidine kinase/response regulator [Prochloraceae cyanobacterium]|nr:hybrid sensor histidine kinase/response regulator [Prochloraceae cyanobacterium]